MIMLKHNTRHIINTLNTCPTCEPNCEKRILRNPLNDELSSENDFVDLRPYYYHLLAYFNIAPYYIIRRPWTFNNCVDLLLPCRPNSVK